MSVAPQLQLLHFNCIVFAPIALHLLVCCMAEFLEFAAEMVQQWCNKNCIAIALYSHGYCSNIATLLHGIRIAVAIKFLH